MGVAHLSLELGARHANVIVNLGGATATDVFALMLAAHHAVRDRFGISLDPEWVLAGALAVRWREATGNEAAPFASPE